MRRTKIRLSQVRELAMLQCTKTEACSVLGISNKQFNTLLKNHEGFRKAWEAGLDYGKMSIRRKQMNLANTNAAMAIHLGKVVLGQSDKSQLEISGPDGGPVEFDFNKVSKADRDRLRKTLAQATSST